MSTCSRKRFIALGISMAATAWSQSPHLGRPASAQLIEAWDISIAPDGGRLPAGRGTPAQGGAIYQAKCASCHGDRGAGGPADQLTGGIGSLASGHPVKTVASFWPYPTTLFDYVRRAMPVTNPQSLSNDEVYALCAYLLSVDKIIAPNFELNALTLPLVQMPNRNGFISAWPEIKTGSHGARDMNHS
jgi:S-disulfanyl-L-cysteine oxidoreductase SoxD